MRPFLIILCSVAFGLPLSAFHPMMLVLAVIVVGAAAVALFDPA